MRRIKLQKVTTWLFGSKDNPQQYTHHVVLLLVSLAYMYAAVFNYVYSAAYIVDCFIQFSVSISIVFVWYWSRWRNQYRRMSILFMGIVALITIPLNWFSNGGSTGPNYLLCVCVLMYISVAFRDFGVYYRLSQLFAIFSPIPLVIIEHYHPNWIYQYPDNTTRLIDLSVSFVVTGVFLLSMMESFAKKYILEQKKSEVLYEKLRELSELDYLTNLLNRRTFENYFNNWRSTKTYLSVASVDLDFF